MKKRIISAMLTIAVVLSVAGGCLAGAAEDKGLQGMDYIAKRLAVFTREDRMNLETIFIPLLISDSGLNSLTIMVEEYTPESEALMHMMLTKLLNRVEKDEIIKGISYLYVIDENIRRDYIGGYYTRQKILLSASAKAGMNVIMDGFFANYPELKAVFEEDGITNEVIARFLKMFSAINKNVPLFKRTLSGSLAVNAIDSELENKINLILADEGLKFSSAKDMLSSVCASLNESYKGSYMESFIELGAELGLVLKGKKDPVQISEKTELDKIKVDFNKETKELKITGAENNAGKLFKVSFKNDPKGYLIGPDGEIVRLCAYENGTWYALLNKSGIYKAVESKDAYFTDANGWGKDYINALYERKIISGRGEGVFAPDDKITREEFVKLIIELFDLKGDFGEYFTDAKRGAWYYEYVSASKFYDIVDGYPDKTFGVGKNITRQDMCKVLYSVIGQMKIKILTDGSALEFADKNEIAPYAYEAVMALRKAGIVSGDDFGRFNPAHNATRQEAAKLIYNILLNYVKR